MLHVGGAYLFFGGLDEGGEVVGISDVDEWRIGHGDAVGNDQRRSRSIGRYAYPNEYVSIV